MLARLCHLDVFPFLLSPQICICAGVYGAYLLAVYDPESEEYQTISKCGTGFSEQQLIDLKAALQPHVIKEPKSYYRCARHASVSCVVCSYWLVFCWLCCGRAGAHEQYSCVKWFSCACAVFTLWECGFRFILATIYMTSMKCQQTRVGDAKPDVWFDAAAVWEVKAADLSISPAYQAALGLVDSSNVRNDGVAVLTCF